MGGKWWSQCSESIWYIFTSAQCWRKCLPVQEVQETGVQSPGREDPLEQGMATHSRILAWKIPWTEDPGGLQSVGSRRVGCYWAHTHRVIKGSAMDIFTDKHLVTFEVICLERTVLWHLLAVTPDKVFLPFALLSSWVVVRLEWLKPVTEECLTDNKCLVSGSLLLWSYF